MPSQAVELALHRAENVRWQGGCHGSPKLADKMRRDPVNGSGAARSVCAMALSNK
jgi:hypothetical protein